MGSFKRKDPEAGPAASEAAAISQAERERAGEQESERERLFRILPTTECEEVIADNKHCLFNATHRYVCRACYTHS